MYNGKKVLLCILDGFGLGDEKNPNNAVAKADMVNLKQILKDYPHTFLKTSGMAVGLEECQMGNSEVGHMTIGSGVVLKQDLVQINDDVKSDFLKDKTAIKNAITKLKNNKGKLNLIGLYSNGGVHSHKSHINYLAKLFAREGIFVNLHIITDGRDVPPRDFLENSWKELLEIEGGFINISTICGRYFAMDRDLKWDRIEKYINCLAFGNCENFDSIQNAITKRLEEKGDEFLTPLKIGNYAGFDKNDVSMIANFRSDRARQLSMALTGAVDFWSIKTELICMKRYFDELNCEAIYETENIKNTMSEVFSNFGLKQLKIAETEKYAHVTFFLNGGREEPFLLEDRILIESPKVETYDLKPEMSLEELTESLVESIKKQEYSLIVANIANGDMVGHTGNFNACVLAAKAIDKAVSTIKNVAIDNDYIMIITADHGNIEEMVDKNEIMHTQHTIGDVPVIFCGKEFYQKTIEFQENLSLVNIAPTILSICNLTEKSSKSIL